MTRVNRVTRHQNPDANVNAWKADIEQKFRCKDIYHRKFGDGRKSKKYRQIYIYICISIPNIEGLEQCIFCFFSQGFVYISHQNRLFPRRHTLPPCTRCSCRCHVTRVLACGVVNSYLQGLGLPNRRQMHMPHVFPR